MSSFAKWLKKPTKLKSSYEEFWQWFSGKADAFHRCVRDGKDVERLFFDELHLELGNLRDGFYFLAGMKDDETAELVLTADGIIKNLVFVEELVAAAPSIQGWIFTAHKAGDTKCCIQIGGMTFSGDTIKFAPLHEPERPDEIFIVLFPAVDQASNREQLEQGVFLLLDNYLGELEFVESVDCSQVVDQCDAKETVQALSELPAYLMTRKRHFIERYADSRRDTSFDEFVFLNGIDDDGNQLTATFNNDAMHWDAKVSHPWIATLTIGFDKRQAIKNKDALMEKLKLIEEKLALQIRDVDGYIYLGQETKNSERTLFYACHEFRKPSRIMDVACQQNASDFKMHYEIFKDKYWLFLSSFGLGDPRQLH